ncbi:MAG: sodium-translocating pyrophosphatase [Bacillota bacterium]|nr:sodium-translocating pyrophosphatase [Bacillota bacterium]
MELASWAPWAGIGAGLLSLLVALTYFRGILRESPGNERMRSIQSAIHEGAMAFLRREYGILVYFVVIVAAVILLSGLLWPASMDPRTAIAFVLGAICSTLAGFIGMQAATHANARTAQAATKGLGRALRVAFAGGSVMGLTVAGLGLAGVALVVALFGRAADPVTFNVVNGFAFGASSIALFARVGGGIYTKAADVGADLVGKVEAGIPEDDPRNPAVIADNVGDNVGDVAGMGADLFESYVASIISSMAIGAAWVAGSGVSLGYIYLPLVTGAVGIIASILAGWIVRQGVDRGPAGALRRGTFAAAILALIGTYLASVWLLPGEGVRVFGAVAAGVVVGVLIGLITEYYTSYDYKPVQGIAQQSVTGTATNIIAGLSVGMASTVLPMLFLAIGVGIAYALAGLYGIGLAAVGMLSTTGMTVSVDAYGPIADNAGGIAEMAELDPKVREVTDHLDAVGNTTAAMAKGFAIGSAALTALALFSSYAQAAQLGGLDLLSPGVVIGLLLGATLPFIFSSLAMQAVGHAANAMITEVRRQFKEIKGLMEGTARPDYARCVDISTAAALRSMVAPGGMAVLVPIVVGLILGKEALGGLLAGATASGVLLALMMANAGGAWDNAKKYIEEGHHGGKGTPAHAAAVVGDTVGDPFKDTAGPSLNILIKLMAIVSIIFAPLFGSGLIG